MQTSLGRAEIARVTGVAGETETRNEGACSVSCNGLELGIELAEAHGALQCRGTVALGALRDGTEALDPRIVQRVVR